MTNPDSILKQRHYFANKGLSSQGYGFSSNHVRMWELDYKKSWMLKNWCFWTVVLEKTLESPLDCKEIQPVHLKGNQSWTFTGRTDAEDETPILWPPHAKSWLTGKDCDAGKDWRDDRWWDGWMALLTRWTWVWASSGSWWKTGKPGLLQSMGSQRVGHDWASESIQLNNEWCCTSLHVFISHLYVFFGKTDAEADSPIIWPPDAKNWLNGKDPDAGKDWRQEEKGTTEDEMFGWHYRSMDMSLSKLRELVMDREAWPAAVLGVSKSWTQLNDWIKLNNMDGLPRWLSGKEPTWQ